MQSSYLKDNVPNLASALARAVQHNEEIMRFFETTKYPQIFERTYWGRFDVESNLRDDEIIENRNAFVEEFDIVKRYHPAYSVSLHNTSKFPVDHAEYYMTSDKKVIFINSPYGQKSIPDMTVYKKLYADDATTYIKIFDNWREMQYFAKSKKPSIW